MGGIVKQMGGRMVTGRCGVSLVALALCALVCSAEDPGTGATDAGQSVADLLRSAANSDAAWVAAGLLENNPRGSDLAGHIAFPTDTVCVVALKGSQIKQALELSLSLYPSPNPGFLQISGLEVNFRPGSPADRRVTDVRINNAPLDAEKVYRVAMPSNLARGGLGYFMVWNESAIEKTLEGVTLGSLLRGQQVRSSAPRWIGG